MSRGTLIFTEAHESHCALLCAGHKALVWAAHKAASWSEASDDLTRLALRLQAQGDAASAHCAVRLVPSRQAREHLMAQASR